MTTLIGEVLINAEVTVKTAAAPHERSRERTTRRNGTRPKTLASPAGEVDLTIPKLRERSFFPSVLGPAPESRLGPLRGDLTCLDRRGEYPQGLTMQAVAARCGEVVSTILVDVTALIEAVAADPGSRVRALAQGLRRFGHRHPVAYSLIFGATSGGADRHSSGSNVP